MRMNKSSVSSSTITSAILLWHSRLRKQSNYMKPGSRSAECWDTQPIKLITRCHPAKWYRSITLVCYMDVQLSGSLKNPRAFCRGCTLTGISFIHEWGFWPNILTFHLESKNTKPLDYGILTLSNSENQMVALQVKDKHHSTETALLSVTIIIYWKAALGIGTYFSLSPPQTLENHGVFF